jgi:hypothetical protein
MTDERWAPISLQSAGALLDMSSGQTDGDWESVGREQLLGAVDTYARLGKQRVMWLCDEVGLGKTYVAMAVAALVRRQHPNARILYLLPSSRLLPKWTHELASFARRNVRAQDHLLRTLQDRPARPIVPVESLHQLAIAANIEPDRDFLCTLGAFSFALPGEGDSRDAAIIKRAHSAWRHAWESLLWLVPAERREAMRWDAVWNELHQHAPDDPDRQKVSLKVAVAGVLNQALPDFDLVICDESHNLRDGLQSVAARNRLLSVALGGVVCDADGAAQGGIATRLPCVLGEALQQRAKRVLMLTATPFRTHFGELSRQAAVFGFTPARPQRALSPAVELATLHTKANVEADTAALVKQRDELVRPFIIRRIGRFKVNGEDLTRNLYRAELRAGGMDATQADVPMPDLNPRERLLLALTQKRVLDVIQPKDTSSAWRFQMGLLSSFESFGQTLETHKSKPTDPTHEGETSVEGQATVEKESKALDALMASYQERFRTRVPHPKLSKVAEAIAKEAWEKGEKSLVFVRRVRTTEELATQVTWHYDELMQKWVSEQLETDELKSEWSAVWKAYGQYRDALRTPELGAEGGQPRSLFGWYFRDHKPKDQPVAGKGGRLIHDELDVKKPWSVLLEDNPLLIIFEHDEAALRAWATKRARELCEAVVAYAYVDQVTGGTVTKRELTSAAWFSGFQAAALDILSDDPHHPHADLARALRPIRTPRLTEGDLAKLKVAPPAFAGEPADWLVLPTLFSELQRDENDALYEEICDQTTSLKALHGLSDDELTAKLTDRDRRQAMIAQLLRTGRCLLDLWLTFVNVGPPKTHSDKGGAQPLSAIHHRLAALSNGLVDRLQRDRPQTAPGAKDATDAPGQALTAWRELAQVARHFPQLTQLNFPKIDDGTPAYSRRVIRNTLTALEPAIALHGKSKSERAMQQFRMPGFPLVMVATSVVQEGVDLHTFCRRVVHYGIDGSATGTEQRNGRVDRRGSLIARLLTNDPTQRIEVFFPHLRQTLEPIQMMQLYRKMNRFMLMANDVGAEAEVEGAAIDAERAILSLPERYPKPYAAPLKTAFDAVDPAPNGGGELGAAPHPDIALPDINLSNWVGVGLSAPVREGAHLRWSTSVARPGTLPPLEVALKLDSGIDPGSCTLVIEAQVEKIELNDKTKPSRDALAALLGRGPGAPGVFWLSRPLNSKQTALVLRSEVPVGGLALADEAVGAWVQRVAALADQHRAALLGEQPTITPPATPQSQPEVVALRVELMDTAAAFSTLVLSAAKSGGTEAAAPNSDSAAAPANQDPELDSQDEAKGLDDQEDEDDQDEPQAARGPQAADDSLRALALLSHNDQLRGPRLLLMGDRLYATADLVLLQGSRDPTVEAERRARLDSFAAGLRARCNLPSRIV